MSFLSQLCFTLSNETTNSGVEETGRSPAKMDSTLASISLIIIQNVIVTLFSYSMGDKKASPSHFDDIIKTVSEFGRWQKFIYFTTCALVIVPSGVHIAGMYFITGTPQFHCATLNTTCDENKCCDNCTEYKFDGPFISTATEVLTDTSGT